MATDDRPQLEDGLEDDLSVSSITVEVIIRAIKSLKDMKTAETNLKLFELLKLLDN